MKDMKQFTFLTLESFKATGGIQNVCKTLTYTLGNIAKYSSDISFFNLSLFDKDANNSYIHPSKFKGYSGNHIAFLKDAILRGIVSHTVIISHINLMAVALIIKLFNNKAKIVMLAHGTEVWRKIPLWKKIFIRAYVEIWAVSSYTRDVLVATHQINPEKVSVLQNCLDPFFKASKKFQKPAELLHIHSLPEDSLILLSVCRMSKHDWQKGYVQVLEMLPKLLKEFPNIHYFMVGHAGYEERVRINTLIAKLKIKRHVTIIGYVPDPDLTKYYQLCDVFVLPSEKEGFGLVFIEAASHGCSVISGDQDGSREALLNGKLGYSVNTSNSDTLERQTAICLRSKRTNISRLQIQNRCLTHFNQRKYQAKVLELLS